MYTSLTEGDIVNIEGLEEREVLDTGGGTPQQFNQNDLEEYVWLDQYIGIQDPNELFQFSIDKRKMELAK